jgi:hypothetical protein
MSFTCADLENALRSEAPELLDAAAAHARDCASCREELRLWREMSEAAPGLRREWESPELWPRIQRALTAEAEVGAGQRRQWATAWRPLLATAAAAVIAVGGAWLFLRAVEPRPAALARQEAERRLLTEDALAVVERAEAEHLRALEELSRLAEPRLAGPSSPLLLSYREKLAVLDAAVVECRAQIERNRFNAHLRRELLAVYGEKQRTLEQILEEEKNAL